jgi:hypothetical protein
MHVFRELVPEYSQEGENGGRMMEIRVYLLGTHFLNPDYERITGTEDSLFPNPQSAEYFIEGVNRRIFGHHCFFLHR